MKKSNVLLLIPFFLFQSMAFGKTIKDERKDSSLTTYQREAALGMLCSRDLAVKFYEGSTRRFGAAVIIKQLKEAYKEQSNVETIVDDCKNLKKMTTEEYKRFELSYDDAAKEEISAKSDSILGIFINPKVSCRGVMAGGGVGAGLSVAVEVGTGICHSENGKRWVQLKAGLGHGVGVGFSGGIGLDNDKGLTEVNSVISKSEGDLQTVSIGLGVMNTTEATELNSENPFIGAEGVSVGFGGVGAGMSKYHLKLIPLLTDKNVLIQILESSIK